MTSRPPRPPAPAATRRVLLQRAWGCGLALRLAAPARAAAPAATGFDLVTEEEAQRELQAGRDAAAPPRSRGMPPPPGPGGVPGIEVVSPAGEATVASPLRLEVNFRPAPDARIRPDSFRVLYGLLKIDLTERLQRQARYSEHGVVVEGARMPQGTHRLLLSVADDKGRVAEQAVVFHVARRP